MPPDRESIADIVESMRLAMQYVEGVTREQFEGDIQRIDSVVRRIEIIGEAVKRVSQDCRQQFPDIPWKAMAAMRDRVIHGYDTVDLEIVWDTVVKLMPSLHAQLQQALDDLNEGLSGNMQRK